MADVYEATRSGYTTTTTSPVEAQHLRSLGYEVRKKPVSKPAPKPAEPQKK